jgi:two-component system, LuxR family, response regulator FixJ
MTAEATVCVVDDNVGVRKSLRVLPESAGLAVETYAWGEEFLAAYDPERPGCLVLDVRLRHDSGLDLEDELRRRKAMLPIIVLTGHRNVPTSVRAPSSSCKNRRRPTCCWSGFAPRSTSIARPARRQPHTPP